MAESIEHQGARTWDLTIIVGLIVALSAVTDIAGFLRFAPSVGLPDWAAVLCVIPVKLIEWKFLTFSSRLWRQGWLGKLQSPVYCIVWAIAVSLSALAAHSTIYTILAAAERSASKNVETRANFTIALDRVNGQLDAFTRPLPRPVTTVEEELRWTTSLRPSLDCARPPDEGSRICKRVAELRKELAAATGYERLVGEARVLREKLASLQIEVANDPMPQAFEASIGQHIKMDGKNGIALMGMLILTLVSAFGPFGLDTLRERQVSPARPEPARDGEPAPDPAQAHRPEGTRVTQFSSAPQGQEACPPNSASGSSGKSAQAPTGGGSGQATEPARRLALDPAHEPTQKPLKGNVVQFAPRSAQDRVDHAAASAAVRAFVGMLELGKHARATGSELAHAYAEQRPAQGWPALPGNILGIHLKIAVQERGGRKFKSGGQVYEGVRLPAEWRAPLVQSA
jgi:hypothetical protein